MCGPNVSSHWAPTWLWKFVLETNHVARLPRQRTKLRYQAKTNPPDWTSSLQEAVCKLRLRKSYVPALSLLRSKTCAEWTPSTFCPTCQSPFRRRRLPLQGAMGVKKCKTKSYLDHDRAKNEQSTFIRQSWCESWKARTYPLKNITKPVKSLAGTPKLSSIAFSNRRVCVSHTQHESVQGKSRAANGTM